MQSTPRRWPGLRARLRSIAAMILVLACTVPYCPAAEPALPGGLDDSSTPQKPSGPSLPSGLGEDERESQSDLPALPGGLGEKDRRTAAESSGKDDRGDAWTLPEDLTGYLEIRGGSRFRDDPVQDDLTLAEGRMQLGYETYLPELLPRGVFHLTADLVLDGTDSDRDDVDLEDGSGFFDLRELWFSLTPLEFVDLKVGRQILTWGTGNLVFLNDLFPKDYQSFFLGRDLDYLKAPSDALKASFYSDLFSLDIVYTPRFDADRFVDGTRLSFFDPAAESLRGEDRPLEVIRPEDWFDDDETAARLYRNFGAYEFALYAYEGFWKSPSGTDPATGAGLFPELAVYGVSVRGPAGPGIANLEFAYYDSRDDPGGDDPFIENSQARALAGYEQEVLTDLTVGVQYYLERMIDYGVYRDTLPPGFPARDEDRHWLTLDLRQELLGQNQLVVSLFTFYDASAGDFHFRPKATYDLTDNWQFQVGANIFTGSRETFFGQFEKNSNGYASVRLSF